MKNIISLFFALTICVLLSCNATDTKYKSVLTGSNVELSNKFADNENLAQEPAKSDFINSLLRDHSEQVILTSLLAMDEFHFLFPDTANVSKVINYGYQIEYISGQNQGVLYQLKHYLDTSENYFAIKTYNRIQSWCSLYQVVMFTFEQIRQGEYDDFNDFGEIIDKIDESKSIVKSKYLKIEGQSYESLSISQQSSLIMDIITYISSLPPKQQVDFVRDFLNLISNERTR